MEPINTQSLAQKWNSYKEIPILGVVPVSCPGGGGYPLHLLLYRVYSIRDSQFVFVLFCSGIHLENVSLLPALVNTLTMTALALALAGPIG